jgi:hypothetical protein
MFDWIKVLLQKRQAHLFVDGVTAWYHACSQVADLAETALQDEEAVAQDIGVILDKTDRVLFSLRDTTIDASRALRRYDPNLADRLQKVSNGIYALRNEVARFLIRAQGPGFPLAGGINSTDHKLHYSQAMMEIGFQARQMKRDLDIELTSLWADLQIWLKQADELLRGS